MLPATTPGSMLDKALSVAQPEDIYYYGSKTMKKQKIPTMQRTNFIQNLASLSGGQSVITLSPAEGMSHVILGLELPAAASGGANYAGCALPRAWAYNAIDFVQWRYGSSSLFQKSGQQLLIETVATAGSQSEANALMNLAGAAQTGAAGDFAGDKLYAYAVIPLPHCQAQSSTEVPNPFPSELLSAPIVITVALKAPSAVIAAITGTAGQSVPDKWYSAYLQVRQINAVDRGQLMGMSSTYAFPCTFFQQANSVQLNASTDPQEVVLTGFRSGSCKGIHVWVVDTTAFAGVGTGQNPNPNAFVAVRDLELSYAGNVIHKYNGVSAQILDTLFTDVPSYIDNPTLALADGGASWAAPVDGVSSWVHFPLSQRFEQLSAEFTDVSGMGISNGVMNLRLTTPASKTTYRLYYVPYYSSAIVMSQGQAEYMF
jgi:hypothetical protein